MSSFIALLWAVVAKATESYLREDQFFNVPPWIEYGLTGLIVAVALVVLASLSALALVAAWGG